MQCEQCREQFSDLYGDTLSHDLAEAVRQHIATCADCAADYAQFVATVDSVRALEPVSPPARLLADISSELDAMPAPNTPAQRALRLGPWLAAAACFAIIFVGVMKHNNYTATSAFEPQARAPEMTRAIPAEPVLGAEMDVAGEATKAAEEAMPIVPEVAADVEQAAEIPAATRPPAEAEPASHAKTRVATVPPQPQAPAPLPPAAPGRYDRATSETPLPRQPLTRRTVPAEAVADGMVGATRPNTTVSPEPGATDKGSADTRVDIARGPAGPVEGTGKHYAAAPVRAAMTDPAAAKPRQEQADKLLVRFIPPRVRRVGQPVTAAVTLSGEVGLPEVSVCVETRSGLRLSPAQDDCIYRGPLTAGEPKQIELKLLAERPGTQRMRVSVATPVAGLQAQMEIILPDFEAGEETAPTPDALGNRVTVTFNETPLRRALLELARQGGNNLVLASSVGNERVTYSCIDTPAASVVRILAETHGYRVTAEDNSYYISKDQ